MSTETFTPPGGAADMSPQARARLAELPAGTIDVVFDAPETVSTFYALTVLDRDYEAARATLTAQRRAVAAARGYLDREAAWAMVTAGPGSVEAQVQEALAAEPWAGPEREEDLYWQVVLRRRAHGPGVVGEFAPATGLRVWQVDHDTAAPEFGESYGDPHVHSHLLVEPTVTAVDDGREYALDVATLERELTGAVAIYEATLEAALGELGVMFDRPAPGEEGRCELRGITRGVYPGKSCHLPRTLRELYPTAAAAGLPAPY